MATYNFEPEKLKILSSTDEITAYVHPTRMRILSQLTEFPATITMTAKSLDTRPANLSHHFRRLEKVGLIVLVETRTTLKNVEKYYRVTARSFVVASSRVPPADQAYLALSILQEEFGIAASRAREENRGEHLALLSSARIPPSQRAMFQKSLQDLIRTFDSSEDPSGEPYTLAVALFPAASTDIGASTITIGDDKKAETQGD
jgi:DNA-binding transcriptional ArsR family regulator